MERFKERIVSEELLVPHTSLEACCCNIYAELVVKDNGTSHAKPASGMSAAQPIRRDDTKEPQMQLNFDKKDIILGAKRQLDKNPWSIQKLKEFQTELEKRAANPIRPKTVYFSKYDLSLIEDVPNPSLDNTEHVLERNTEGMCVRGGTEETKEESMSGKRERQGKYMPLAAINLSSAKEEKLPDIHSKENANASIQPSRPNLIDWTGDGILPNGKGFPTSFFEAEPIFNVRICDPFKLGDALEESFRLCVEKDTQGRVFFSDPDTMTCNSTATKFLQRDHETLDTACLKHIYEDASRIISYNKDPNINTQAIPKGFTPDLINKNLILTVIIQPKPVLEEHFQQELKLKVLADHKGNPVFVDCETNALHETATKFLQKDHEELYLDSILKIYGDCNKPVVYIDCSEISNKIALEPHADSNEINKHEGIQQIDLNNQAENQLEKDNRSALILPQNLQSNISFNARNRLEKSYCASKAIGQSPSIATSARPRKKQDFQNAEIESEIDEADFYNQKSWIEYRQLQVSGGDTTIGLESDRICGKSQIGEIDVLETFIRDLIEVYHVQEDISTLDLYVYDDNQDKITHLFELLCQADSSPAFLKLLTIKRIKNCKRASTLSTTEENDDRKEYKLVLSILSLIMGDYSNFHAHCDALVKSISQKDYQTFNETKELTILVMSLVHGVSSDPDLHIEIDVEKKLQSFFKLLFKTTSETALDFHTLLSRSQYELGELFKEDLSLDPTSEYNQTIILLRKRMDRIIYSKFNFDQESFEYFTSLLCLTLGQPERVEFIANEFDLSPATTDILKAIITQKIEEMEPLFNLIQKRTKNKISTNLQKLYTNILRSDIGGAFMLMFGYTPVSNMVKRLSYYIRIFNMIISPTHCSAQEISEVLKIEEIINEIDEVELDRDHILNSIQLCQGKLPIERVKDVAIKILEGCGRWDLKEFLETSDHTKLIDALVGALNGNIYDFGRICDFLFYGGKTWICSFLTSMVGGSSVFCLKEKGLTPSQIKELIWAHSNALMRSIITKDPESSNEDNLITAFTEIFTYTLCKKNKDITDHIEVHPNLNLNLPIPNICTDHLGEDCLDTRLVKLTKAIAKGKFESEINELLQIAFPYIKEEITDNEDIFEDLKEQDEGNLFIFMEKNKLQGELIISNQYNPRSCPYEIYHRGRTGTIWDLATLLKNFLEISVGKSSAVHSLIDATFISIFQNSNRNISIIPLKSCTHLLLNSPDSVPFESLLEIATLALPFLPTPAHSCLSLICLLLSLHESIDDADKTSQILIEISEQIVTLTRYGSEQESEENREEQMLMSEVLGMAFGLSAKRFEFVPGITPFHINPIPTKSLLLTLFKILEKYHSKLFTQKSSNHPALTKLAQNSFYFIKRQLENPNFEIRNSASYLVDQAEDFAKNAVQGLKQEAKETANELVQYVKTSSESYIREVMLKDLFQIFDRDHSGSLCFAEFQDLCRYIGVELGNEKALRMFSITDTNKDNLITLDEFPEIMKLLTKQIARDTLRRLNLTTQDLIMLAVLTLSYLILALVFIFLGIFTFSRADGFSAVINSIMPLIAGTLAALRTTSIYQRLDNVKEYIEEFIRKMRKT
ncbi:unnamed protein product [Moneuplotes crassus]|uniref:EF-hand domain-containing protein n=1 Tax=Euplotes crassus TaxID=5936 RepID=A0AAD1Y7V4_EUPCR|nr:unnamed protein product [Moneuplotes crassus]